MNYHSDEWIMNEVKEHYTESLTYFKPNQIVGIFYQGSGNYGLDYENSDVDTKLILTPSLKDIVFNKKPVSTTHVRADNSHTDWKDIRAYISTFRKQNLNFLEILFTKYRSINYHYLPYWKTLEIHREEIAHYNPYAAVKAMKGVAMEKYHAFQHLYPSKADVLGQYSYDPKQLHHLLRVEDYLERYIAGEKYENCLIPLNTDYLLAVKRGLYHVDDAVRIAEESMNHILQMSEEFCDKTPNKGDPKVDEILDMVQWNIMRFAVKDELERTENQT